MPKRVNAPPKLNWVCLLGNEQASRKKNYGDTT